MRRIFFLLLISFILISEIFPQQIREIIPLLNLTAGEEKTFFINDFFYAENYDGIIFQTDTSLMVYYEPTTGEVSIKPSLYKEGFALLPFKFSETEFTIIGKSEIKQAVTFTYKPENEIERINLFGSFNGWNRENHLMHDEDNDGIHEISISLDPGRYEYKFFIDGEELVDPLNPDQVPNGFGGWNSVISVKPLYAGKTYLHQTGYLSTTSGTLLTFYYESGSHGKTDVIALLDNEPISENFINIESRRIFINLPQKVMSGLRTIRLGVNEDNRASNLQTILLYDGQPVGDMPFTTWYDAVIYSIMIDRFYDGDPANSIPVEHPELYFQANYQGGDLQGIIDKLEEGYFEKLGINTFWLSPVIDNTNNAYKEFPAPHRYYTGYHGYWPIHPTRVEEKFGNMDLLKKLIRLAQSTGIKVLLDFVANHVHEEHPFWKEHRDWFGVLELPDGSLNLRKWDEHRLTTWFEPYMPSFDFEGSREALEVMTDNAVWWLEETGADGFRHDAVKHIPNEFWRMLTRKIKERLQVPNNKIYYQVGETFGSYELVSSYVNNGQLDAQFNFNLYDTAIPVFIDENLPFTALDEQMNKTFSVYGVNHLMGNVMDSHDKVRFMAYADGDVTPGEDASEIGWINPPQVDNKSSYDKLKLYLTYLITIPGIPIVYYGDEIGMTGAADPDNRRMMRFDDDLTEWEKETLVDAGKIIQLRSKHSALRYGDFLTILADQNIYAYIRSDMNERILIVLNKSSETEEVELKFPGFYEIGKAENLLSGESYNIKDDQLVLNLKERSFIVLKLKRKN